MKVVRYLLHGFQVKEWAIVLYTIFLAILPICLYVFGVVWIIQDFINHGQHVPDNVDYGAGAAVVMNHRRIFKKTAKR